MIIVEIEVPAIGKQYDFRMDENALMGAVKREVAEMVCQKEQRLLQGEEDRLLMWDIRKRTRLCLNRTVQENGLKTGSRILLV